MGDATKSSAERPPVPVRAHSFWFRNPQGSLAQKRQEVERRLAKKTREATRRFVLRVDRFVEVIGDKGLEMFQKPSP